MKPPRFEYVRPESVEEALAVLAEHGDDAKVLAGGQSLVPMLNMRLASPGVVVDVNRIPDLDGIAEVDGAVRAGALVRQAAFERSDVVRRRLPLVAECLPHVGHFVTRNRGTVGGSIAHGDAKAELPLTFLAHGGTAVVRSARGERTIPAEELFVTHYTTSLEPDELLVATLWPDRGAAVAFEEFALRAGDYALAMAACVLGAQDRRVTHAIVTVGGPHDRPSVMKAGDHLIGQEVSPSLAREIGQAARAEVDPADSLHASAAYQRHLVGLLVERAVLRAWRSAPA